MIISILLSFIKFISTSKPVIAADTSARVISIFKIEGTDVTMTKGTAKEFNAKEA